MVQSPGGGATAPSNRLWLSMAELRTRTLQWDFRISFDQYITCHSLLNTIATGIKIVLNWRGQQMFHENISRKHRHDCRQQNRSVSSGADWRWTQSILDSKMFCGRSHTIAKHNLRAIATFCSLIQTIVIVKEFLPFADLIHPMRASCSIFAHTSQVT